MLKLILFALPFFILASVIITDAKANPVTRKQAKEQCKAEGKKKSKELLQCIKEKVRQKK